MRSPGRRGNQRRSHHDAVVLRRCQLSVNTVTARSSLIAEPQLVAIACQLCNQRLHGSRRVRDLAILAHFIPFARLGKRHRYRLFVHIQPDERDKLLQGPSPMHEARHRPFRRNPRKPAYCETGRPYLRRTSGLASPKAADALERAYLRPMVMCLLHGEARKESIPFGRRSLLAKRFEAAVEANVDVPLLIPDLCRLVGVSERTLRTLCQEQLGVSPQRFLALRRLHLARRALLRSDGHSTTVTEIATGCGFWELGRFAAIYKSLFGESPSATLHRRS